LEVIRMTENIKCPNFDGNWGCKGVCRIVRNWNVRGSTPSAVCTPQEQEDFTDFHGAIPGVTKNYGELFGRPGDNNALVDRRLKVCCCPLVTKDAGNNRENRNILLSE